MCPADHRMFCQLTSTRTGAEEMLQWAGCASALVSRRVVPELPASLSFSC